MKGLGFNWDHITCNMLCLTHARQDRCSVCSCAHTHMHTHACIGVRGNACNLGGVHIHAHLCQRCADAHHTRSQERRNRGRILGGISPSDCCRCSLGAAGHLTLQRQSQCRQKGPFSLLTKRSTHSQGEGGQKVRVK